MITDEFLDKTIKVWQPHYKEPLTREDARQIIETTYSVIKMLLKWRADDATKGAASVNPSPNN